MSDTPNASRPGSDRPDDDTDPTEEYQDVDPDTVTDDAIEFFAAEDEGPPVSDADAPAPPG